MTGLQQALSVEASPLHDRAAEHCRTNAWTRVGRLTLVDVYTTVEEEYWALKADAGLADLSAQRSYRIQGADALAGLAHLVTRRLDDLRVGGLRRTLWCNDAGLVIGQGMVLRESEDSLLIVTEEPCLAWIEDTLEGYDCAVAELSAGVARLSLQGPAAASVLDGMGLSLARQLEPMQLVMGALRGLQLGVARRDAERFELWLAADEARVLWDRLIQAGRPLGLKPVGRAAQTVLRIEAGEPLQGIDFVGALRARFPAEMVRPETLGLDALVERGKPGFVGRTALMTAPAPGRRLVRLLAETAQPLQGAILTGTDQRPIGYLTSSGYAPALGASLAFGWLEREPDGAIGLVLAPDAGSAGKLRQIPCRLIAQ